MIRLPRFALTMITTAPLLVFSASALAQEMETGPLATAIPVNSPWALAVIALLIMTVGFLALRRSGVRADRFLTIALPVLSGALVTAALTGPQVIKAMTSPFEILLTNPAGEIVTFGAGGAGDYEFTNSTDARLVILDIRDLDPCEELIFQSPDVAAGIMVSQCAVRGQADPPSSVDMLAPGDSCWIYAAPDFRRAIVESQSQALNGPLCRAFAPVGPQGPQGPEGPEGPQGPQGL